MTDDDRRAATAAELEATKAVVAQAIARIFNGGDLDAADELYAPDIAADAKAWVAPFRESFPDVQVTTVALIAEGNTVVGLRLTDTKTFGGGVVALTYESAGVVAAAASGPSG